MDDFPLIPVIFSLIGMAFYAIPSFVAFRRNHPNRWIIFAINMAFGATVIGWIGALVWALNAAHLSNQANGSHGGESGLNIFINDEKRLRILPSLSPETAPAAVGDGIDIRTAVAELERLKKLRSDGELSQQQFEALKTILLNRVV